MSSHNNQFLILNTGQLPGSVATIGKQSLARNPVPLCAEEADDWRNIPDLGQAIVHAV